MNILVSVKCGTFWEGSLSVVIAANLDFCFWSEPTLTFFLFLVKVAFINKWAKPTAQKAVHRASKMGFWPGLRLARIEVEFCPVGPKNLD